MNQNSNTCTNRGMESAPFPDDLVQLQTAWNRTYTALAVPRPAGQTALRRRLLALSVRLWWHPFWSQPGRGAGARVELRNRVQAWGGQ
ncbi:hypothetical protein [Streptomyces sp. NPDC127038]|uniref:hypothetical protein n=1 Tax=Streptomyces sp. NPDC127038 TaxID=3347114 RepID=UPI003666B7C9